MMESDVLMIVVSDSGKISHAEEKGKGSKSLLKLPLLSWREVVKALAKIGFTAGRQKGSHIILIKDERVVPVPRHDQIERGLLMEALRINN
jgi:predicted RNA binding protein YcfA (HicA-like mRNA interferase family)